MSHRCDHPVPANRKYIVMFSFLQGTFNNNDNNSNRCAIQCTVKLRQLSYRCNPTKAPVERAGVPRHSMTPSHCSVEDGSNAEEICHYILCFSSSIPLRYICCRYCKYCPLRVYNLLSNVTHLRDPLVIKSSKAESLPFYHLSCLSLSAFCIPNPCRSRLHCTS